MADLIGMTGCHSRRKRVHQLVPMLVAVFVVLFGAAVQSWAECDPTTNNKGEQLKCKFDALASEGEQLMDQLQEPPFGELQTDAAKRGLSKSQDRLVKEKSRLKAEDFRLLTKKKDASCQFVEAAGVAGNEDDDAVCDIKTETCAEVMNDGIGNDDGECFPLKGKKREVCVQICDETTLQDEENVDPDLATEYEGVLDEVTGHVKEMKDYLQEAAVTMKSMEIAADSTDPCSLDTGGLSRTNFILYVLAKTAALSVRGATDIAERFCDSEAIAGCAACCAPAEAIAGGLEAAWTAIELTESSINSATIDSTLSCVAKLKGSADANTLLLTEIEADLDEVEIAQDLMIQRLNMPQGQRLNLPATSVK